MLTGKCAAETDSSGDDCDVFVTSPPLLDLATSLDRPAGCEASTGVDGCDASRGRALASNNVPVLPPMRLDAAAAADAVAVDTAEPALTRCKPAPLLFTLPTLLSDEWCWWWWDALVAVGVPECA